jgi:Spy/CpxP family protein refolding chaperone
MVFPAKIFVTGGQTLLSSTLKANKRSQTKHMKKTLVTLLAVGAIGTGFAVAHEHGERGARGGRGQWGHHNPLDRMTESLNLTPDQQAKVQPIIDSTKPQLAQIHKEAMDKSKGVIDNAMAQIRPILTPEQQKKADEMRQAHEDMRKAAKRMHDLKKDQ